MEVVITTNWKMIPFEDGKENVTLMARITKKSMYTPVPQHSYHLEHVATGLLAAIDPQESENGALLQLSAQADVWTLEPAASGTFLVRNQRTGKLLDVIYASVQPGAWTHQWEAAPESPSQQWVVKQAGEDSCRILTAQEECCLVPAEDGLHLQLALVSEDPAQLWRLKDQTPAPKPTPKKAASKAKNPAPAKKPASRAPRTKKA